jgi:hypothetical protein
MLMKLTAGCKMKGNKKETTLNAEIGCGTNFRFPKKLHCKKWTLVYHETILSKFFFANKEFVFFTDKLERQKELESIAPLAVEDGNDEQTPMESTAPLGAEDSKEEQTPLEMDRGIETRETSNGEGASSHERAKDGERKKLDSLRKAVSEMSVSELEELVNSKKRGRPKNDEKELKQSSRKELSRRRSVSNNTNKPTTDG